MVSNSRNTERDPRSGRTGTSSGMVATRHRLRCFVRGACLASKGSAFPAPPGRMKETRIRAVFDTASLQGFMFISMKYISLFLFNYFHGSRGWFCLSHKSLLRGLSDDMVLIFILNYSRISTNDSPVNFPPLSEKTVLGAPKTAIQCFTNILAVIFSGYNSCCTISGKFIYNMHIT